MAILNDRSALGGAPASGDLLFVTDISDTTDAASGTDKKMTADNLDDYLKSTTKTLTNKTIDAANNTLSLTADSVDAITEIAAALKSGADLTLITGTAGTASDLAIWNADGDLVDGPTPPSGTIVGTTDSQTLTNKTIDGDNNTISNLDLGNEVDWAAIGDVSDRTAFASGDKVLIFEAGVGMRKVDYDDLPGAGGGLSNIVEDTTPQLGGSLDVNGNKIVSVTNGNIDIEPNGTGNVLLGNFTFDADQTVGAGQDNYVLTYDNGTGLISLEASAGGGLSNIVEDTTPQLGGNLDGQTFTITTTADITGGGIHVTGDTAAGDNAALGYTATEGLILTGQGSGNDITIKNDADQTVAKVLTGSQDLTLSASLFVAEQTAAGADVTAQGQVWVKDDTPNNLRFTDDAGNDVVVAHNNSDIRYVELVVFDWTTDTATGDGKFYWHTPAGLDGYNLVEVHAEVITAGTTGTTDIQIHNVDNALDMLSTKLTIDSAETGSDTAATPAVINATNDHVNTNDVIRIDVDAVSTTAAKGLIVTMGFQLP